MKVRGSREVAGTLGRVLGGSKTKSTPVPHFGNREYRNWGEERTKFHR